MAGIKQVVLRHYSENDCLLINKVIGNNLRVARQNAGYTQSQVMDITWDKKIEIESAILKMAKYPLISTPF